MNDQVAAQLRQFLQITGTVLTTFGVIKSGTADIWIPFIMLLAGPIMQLGSIAWSIKANTKASIIQSATQMPEVDSKKLVAAISDPMLKEAAKNPSPMETKS